MTPVWGYSAHNEDNSKSHKLYSFITCYSFSDETPSRFKKHIVKAIAAPNGVIELKSLNAVLENIGRSDAVLSKEEETLLLKEAGAKDGSLSVAKMMELM